MECVKDMKYTEIAEVFVKGKNGGWKLVTDDASLMECIKEISNGELDLFIDSNVDKRIAPMKQMQPHVIVRPRKNPEKWKYMTIKDINLE